MRTVSDSPLQQPAPGPAPRDVGLRKDDHPAAADAMAGRRRWAARMAAVLLPLLLLATGPIPRTGAQGPNVPPTDEGSTYGLVDTYENTPWELTAGRFGKTGDMSSAPDGTVYLLDTRNTAGRPRALHMLDADGRPQEVLAFERDLTDGRHQPFRLDIGFDGTIHVLSEGAITPVSGRNYYTHRVWRLRADGSVIDYFEYRIESPRRYLDIGVRDDGRVYLVRAGRNPWCVQPNSPPLENVPGEEPQYSIDVFSADGELLEILIPDPLRIPTGIDVAREGTIFIINRVPSPCAEGGGPGEPQPTARPSDAGAAPEADSGGQEGPASLRPELAEPDAETVAALQQAGRPVNGVIVVEPDHVYRETVPFFGVDDIAVGPAGVYLSRNVELFRLYEDGGDGKGQVEQTPMFVGPTGHVYAGFLRRIVFFLDVPANGRVLAGMNHCYFQGYVGIDDPDERPAVGRMVGALDAPELEGPAYPLRVAAGEELAVLLGRMDIYGMRPGHQYRLTNYTTEAQTVQRWGLQAPVPQGGRLNSQVGLCPDADIWYGSDNWLTRDVAIDDRDIYTIDPELLQLRPDDGWPEWTYWPGFLLDDPDLSSFLGAASADDGRVAVLDLGADSVVVVGRDGQLIESWSADAGGAIGHAIDLALDGDRIYLADQARGQVVVTDLQGRVRDSWPTHDGPLSIDIGPTGDVILLGRGGFGFHYSPSGTLLASWAMPDRGAQARDIAVGDDGRVYVNFLRLDTPVLLGSTSYTTITGAGVWVFERTGRPLGPPPPARACVPRPDKWAHEPRRIPLGDTVDVSLTVDGWCPGTQDEAQIMFVVDTSRSMLLRDSLGQGKSALMDMLDGLDPTRVEVGLVTFDFGPTLRQQLGRDFGEVRQIVASLEADGDTQLGGALGTAYAELTGERGNPNAKRVIVLITDGVFKDDPSTFPPAVRLDILDEGIDFHAVVFPSWEFRPDHSVMLELLVGDPGRVIVQPEPGAVRGLTDILTGYTPEEGLFETITVIDKVPENMTYIEGSARPFATWDDTERTLTWQFGVTPAFRQLEMTYTLRPQQVGTWPTNVWARGPYTDALGNDGQVVFPIPEVEVFALSHRVYLPYGFTCPKPRRADIALILDASSSMLEPAAGGGTKIEAAREATRAFLDAVSLGGDRVSLVEFGADARVVTPLTADRKGLEAGLMAIAPSLDRQGTRIDLGLAQANVALRERRAEALPVVILLTDGLQTSPPGPDAVRAERDALLAEVPDALVYTIGLGESVDGPLLVELAGARQRSFLSPSTADLRAIYGNISERLGCE